MEPVLKLEGVCKAFGGVVTARNVDLEVFPGEIHGLIGPNGAGKTTMMNLISGIYSCDGGKISFNGQDVTAVPSYKRARMGIGRTFQTPRFLTKSSIRDNLYIGTDLKDQLGFLKSFFGVKGSNFEEEIKEYLSLTGFKLDWDDDIETLPFGHQKLLEIVRSLLSKPKVMLIDEPAAGLNSAEIQNVMDLIRYAAREKGIGVLVIEHRMDMMLTMCDVIDVLNFGEIIGHGTPEEIVNMPQVLRAYLGGDTDA